MKILKYLSPSYFDQKKAKRNTIFSQSGQDYYISQKMFGGKKDKGFFIDIGANDGITFSNTYYFEKELHWDGICFEPNPSTFEKLKKNRVCECHCAAISDFNGKSEFLQISGYSEMLSGLTNKYDERLLDRINQELSVYGGTKEKVIVDCVKLETILEKKNIFNIDYLSIDTEGADFDILKTIDFEKIKIKIISIENNYDDGRIEKYLKPFGFYLINTIGADEIYRKDKLI